MSEPYDFFPGAVPQQPGAPAGQPVGQPTPGAPGGTPYGDPAATNRFGAPISAYDAPAAVAAPVAAPAPDRPATVALLGGLLVAQAALAGTPAVALLLVRDLIGRLMDALTSGLSGATGGLPGLDTSVTSSSSGTGKLTLWAVAWLLVAVVSAVTAVGVLDRRVWAFVGAAATEVFLLAWAVLHFGDWPSVSVVALLLAVVTGGLLAAPDVRRWCLDSG